jgi:hypothetical protein
MKISKRLSSFPVPVWITAGLVVALGLLAFGVGEAFAGGCVKSGTIIVCRSEIALDWPDERDCSVVYEFSDSNFSLDGWDENESSITPYYTLGPGVELVDSYQVCTGAPGIAPAIWLADVCEPFDGFSGDGNMTWDSDADEFGFRNAIYVGTSYIGPWNQVPVNGPPWVFQRSDLEDLALILGADSYQDLYLKASDAGTPAHIGNTIRERAARMDEICNPE